MTTCDPSAPSVSFTGTLDRCTTRASCKYPISFTLQNANSFSCESVSVVAGSPVTVTPSASPANLLQIETPKSIEIRLNGSATWLQVDRVFLSTMTVSSVELRNELLDPPEEVLVEVYFAQGDVL